MEICNSSAEIIPTNHDLLTQILLRLPVKPLLRFKSISKYWLSLISSPQFSTAHTLRNPNPTVSGLILRKSPLELKFLSFNSSSYLLSLNFLPGLKVLQSCNGLILCSTLPQVGTKRKYYVSNPTTKQISALPPVIDDSSSSITIFGFNLAFDPSKSCNYRIICVRSMDYSLYHYQIEIYASEAGAWRLSGSPFVAPFDMVFDSGVYWNGVVHWISPKGKGLYFDVDKESIDELPIRPFSHSWGQRKFRYFGQCGGHLHLIEIYGSCSLHFRVFELDKNYSNWCFRYEVGLGNCIAKFPRMVRRYLDPTDLNYYAFIVLSVVEEQNEKDSFLLLHIPSKIISYNFEEKTLKEMFEFGSRLSSKDSLQFGWLDAYQYIESLVPV